MVEKNRAWLTSKDFGSARLILTELYGSRWRSGAEPELSLSRGRGETPQFSKMFRHGAFGTAKGPFWAFFLRILGGGAKVAYAPPGTRFGGSRPLPLWAPALLGDHGRAWQSSMELSEARWNLTDMYGGLHTSMKLGKSRWTSVELNGAGIR